MAAQYITEKCMAEEACSTHGIESKRDTGRDQGPRISFKGIPLITSLPSMRPCLLEVLLPPSSDKG
jgi:hypothetical protein